LILARAGRGSTVRGGEVPSRHHFGRSLTWRPPMSDLPARLAMRCRVKSRRQGRMPHEQWLQYLSILHEMCRCCATRKYTKLWTFGTRARVRGEEAGGKTLHFLDKRVWIQSA